VARMTELTTAGKGWINLLPEVEPSAEVPPSGGLLSLFTARGPAVPLGTWSAGAEGKRGPGRPSIGVQHGSGPKAVARLADLGLALPPGGIKVQDHPRRGLVLTVPATSPHDEVLYWLLSAMHALSLAPLSGDWLAQVYPGR
jgi:hypothetical protein